MIGFIICWTSTVVICRGSAGRAEPLNSHPATSRDDVCSEAGVNKRSVEMFRRYVDVNRLTDA